ncbi:hypothetical protein pEaSNUABM50_00533 [Erwinia phage pEa_SNUABM_50]|uniref:Uncharacterized protein n=1 Tax=Erwinia phage pEa_SNUABM_50 TaxID=2768775 RepID=A0A7L8ZPZ3_9CAUD|nr:hypothetical protein pEaSNUABM50_00533 [Erwinia phage pEa_SNUABM_50]QXO11655.1 hypothetical protein pEaSNUABM19_00544 [Erwinia phage pEa_SNUABM_19]QXO12760.1 hypothetical protein pEaSNUABM49_00547 [Erwinia phage pEa_SNUABM_49]
MSHKDKRSVSTDALDTLGTIHTRDEHRDAIHLGVEPVIAGEDIAVGANIGIGTDGKAYATDFRSDIKAVGISDPFLRNRINEGESFWLVVYPRKITSLRHVWSHPDFDSDEPVLDISSLSSEEIMAEVQKRLVQSSTPPVQSSAAPELDESLRIAEAFTWIDNYADNLGLNVEELIDYADSWVNSQKRGSFGEYLCKGGLLEGEWVSDEFWDNYDVYRSTKTLDEHRGSFFTCSC